MIKFEFLQKSSVFYRLILIAIFIGCSPASNYKLLSTFFDGVPNPKDDTKSADSIAVHSISIKKLEPSVAQTKTGIFLHPVYQKKQCDRCHDINHAYRLLERQPDLCYRCHENYNKRYEFIHGPVAAGYCISCHHPHKSEYRKLLLLKTDRICTHCHESGDVILNPAHKSINDINCIDCHNSHGGKNFNMLKEITTNNN